MRVDGISKSVVKVFTMYKATIYICYNHLLSLFVNRAEIMLHIEYLLHFNRSIL
jgi:hypothetical protein